MLVLLAGIKFTSAVMAAGLACAAPILLRAGGLRGPCWRKLILSSVSALGVAVFLAGVNPYVSNMLRHGHPFHPLMGKDRIDIIGKHADSAFLERDRFSKLFLSTFSRSHNRLPAFNAGPTIALKAPFSVSLGELETFYAKTDVRVGGFGPLFSGVVVVAFLTVALVLLRHGPAPLGGVLAIGLVIFSSAMILPEPWWARYVPQLWLLPVLAGMAPFVANCGGWPRRFGVLTLSLILLNAALVAGLAWFGVVKRELDLRAQMHGLSLAGAVRPVEISWPEGRSFESSGRVRLKSFGVNYVVAAASSCARPMPVVASNGLVCFGSQSPDPTRFASALAGFLGSHRRD